MAPVPAFNDEEVTYLQTLLAQYQRSTGQEKAGLREKSAKHIVSLRQEDEANNHAMDLYTIIWFSNHTTTKKQRAPLEVGQCYFGERVFGREEKVKVSEAAASDTLKDWNLARWELWEKLSEEDQEKYDLMAEEWNEKGPTDAQKAQMAQRRGVGWMRDVVSMFHRQCGLDVMIYGLFKNPEGKLKALSYDITEYLKDGGDDIVMYREKHPEDWDMGLRQKFWDHMQPLMEAEEADDSAVRPEVGRRGCKATVPFSFDTYPNGSPILTDQEGGKTMPPNRMREILRPYIRDHYACASGEGVQAPPWSALRDEPHQFFADGMLPAAFSFDDPSHIRGTAVVQFFDHVLKMEDPARFNLPGPAKLWQFSHYRSGSSKEGKFEEAKYAGAPPPWLSKKVKGRRFQIEGDETADGGEGNGLGHRKKGRRASRQGGKRKTQGRPGGEKKTGKPKNKGKKRKQGRKTVAHSSDDELDAEFSSASEDEEDEDELAGKPEAWLGEGEDDNADDDEDYDTDEYLELDEVMGGKEDFTSAIAVVGSDKRSDDECDAADIAGVLRGPEDGPSATSIPTAAGADGRRGGQSKQQQLVPVVLITTTVKGKGKGKARAPVVDPATAPENRLRYYRAPNTAGGSAGDRLKYLKSLCQSAEYHALLDAASSSLDEPRHLPGSAPVVWATWSQRSPHLPDSIHRHKGPLEVVVQYLSAGLDATWRAANIQRYCLAAGIFLRDVHIGLALCPNKELPEGVPEFFTTSLVEFKYEQPVLAACKASADRLRAHPAIKGRSASKSRAKTPGQTAAGAAGAAQGVTMGASPPAAGEQRAAKKRPREATPFVGATMEGTIATPCYGLRNRGVSVGAPVGPDPELAKGPKHARTELSPAGEKGLGAPVPKSLEPAPKLKPKPKPKPKPKRCT
ncbi:hypothetical protein LXA43DRAFT_1067400 [Ganoderma leucocontextum]|nr:hypothetical protein LXA43DRAFT_1067400 [Ganoderma leucocontextum]